MNSQWQRIVLWDEEDNTVSLGLGEVQKEDVYWQFNSKCELFYHWCLVDAPLERQKIAARNVLLAGGGDGLAARNLLRTPGVQKLTVVELDPEMVRLTRGEYPEEQALYYLSQASFLDPRVDIVVNDAEKFMKLGELHRDSKYDMVVLDFPDPDDNTINLYTPSFYKAVRKRMRPNALLSLQGDMDTQSRTVDIGRNLEAAGFKGTHMESRDMEPMGRGFFFSALA